MRALLGPSEIDFFPPSDPPSATEKHKRAQAVDGVRRGEETALTHNIDAFRAHAGTDHAPRARYQVPAGGPRRCHVIRKSCSCMPQREGGRERETEKERERDRERERERARERERKRERGREREREIERERERKRGR